MQKIALILTGGKGTRLWPLSRENYPKQFIEFKEGLSLFQLTIKRLLPIFSTNDIFIISQENYKFTIYNQIELLPGLKNNLKNPLKKNVIFEPIGKSTLPAVLLAIKQLEVIRNLKNNDLLYVFPSDHIIEPISKFKSSLKNAGELARKDKIVVFGVTLGFPQKGYGYIMAKKPYFPSGFLVERFVEKPSFQEARTLLDKGAFCNAGIFCFSKKVFLEELSVLRPDIFKYYTFGFKDFLKKFKNIPPISIDYGIMQQTKKAALVNFRLKWTDLGSWDSFLQFYTLGQDNFKIGKAEFVESKGCFAYSKNRLLCLVGLRDVLAIDSPDALLLVKKGYSDKVRQLVSLINKKGYLQSKDSSTIYRPWGYYTVLHEEKGYKVKEIGIYPKKSISLQKHKYRSEHWNVVRGEAHVFMDGRKVKVRKNEGIFVPRNTKHQVSNATNKIVKIIEVQIGSYLGEDDIRRFSDYA
jgi:mannose-1-phosphate guanylyltransferase/mannose-6-phosphate isomerase